jgi:hypothetical protein
VGAVAKEAGVDEMIDLITLPRATVQQALEALELDAYGEPPRHERNEAIIALKAALEQPEQEPVAWMHKETGLLRREISRPKGADWDANYWQPLYATAQPTAEDIAQEWDLLKETQAALRDAWAILKKLKAVQNAARELVESDPDSAADTEGEAFAAWCALVAAIDDADTLLCEFGESHE